MKEKVKDNIFKLWITISTIIVVELLYLFWDIF